MDRLEIKLNGKVDRRGKEYYTATTRLPVDVDLSNTTLLIFPWSDTDESGKEVFGADLVIKKYDPEFNSRRAARDVGQDGPEEDSEQ